MREKQWKIIDEQFISYYGGTGHLISDGECEFWLWHGKEESQKVCDKLNSILDENEQLKKENQNYKYLLQDMGLLMSDEEVVNIRNEISDKLLKPLLKGNGFDVDINTDDGFKIIPKGDVE